MAQPGRRSGDGERERRGRSGGDPRARHAPPRSKDTLLRLAEELEEHGRALLARARELRRLAGAPAAGKPGAESPRERAGRGEASRRREDAPEWAPKARRRRSP